MKIDNSPARGMRDLLPEAVAHRDRVLAEIVGVYSRFGYRRIETPAVEDVARLTSGQGGENEKLIFRILRRGLPSRLEAGTESAALADLGLRYDLTVPLTRFYADNHAVLPAPFRSFQFGPVWRAERPQKGRYRQFNQCDIDILGELSVLAEMELIEATTGAMEAIGLTGAVVRISDRRLLSALAAWAGLPEASWPSFFIGLDKLDKIGWERVRDELVQGAGLDPEGIDKALERVRELRGLDEGKIVHVLADRLPTLPDDTLSDLAATCGHLAALSRDATWTWEFDPTLVRGPGYYTGQVFEVGHPGSDSSIAGGGRYDQLIGRSLSRDVPACGFSIGFERIIDLVEPAPVTDAIAVLYEKGVSPEHVLATARNLRLDGASTAPITRSGKFSVQLDRLQRHGFSGFVYLRPGSEGTDIGPVRSLIHETGEESAT